MGLIEDARELLIDAGTVSLGTDTRYWHKRRDAWLARYAEQGKVKVRIVGVGRDYFEWEIEEFGIEANDLFKGVDAAIADAKRVAELLGIEIEVEGEK